MPVSLKTRLNSLFGPAPMQEYADYDEYWVTRDQLSHVMHRWEVAVPHIPQAASVLDIGCGSGQFLAYLHEQRPDAELSGADISQVAVEKTQARGFKAFQLELPGDDIPQRYDIITAFEVIEHIGDAEAAILKMIDKADRLIISMPNVGFIMCRLRLLFGRFPLTRCQLHIKEHLRHWTDRDFREWTARLGLKIVHQEPQYVSRLAPNRRWPSLWSHGQVWVIERA